MADEKETKLEIVDISKPLKDLENTIRDVFPKIAKIGQDMGKDLAGAIIKGYENMGYEFREVEIQKSESTEEPKRKKRLLNDVFIYYPQFENHLRWKK